MSDGEHRSSDDNCSEPDTEIVRNLINLSYDPLPNQTLSNTPLLTTSSTFIQKTGASFRGFDFLEKPIIHERDLKEGFGFNDPFNISTTFLNGIAREFPKNLQTNVNQCDSDNLFHIADATLYECYNILQRISNSETEPNVEITFELKDLVKNHFRSCREGEFPCCRGEVCLATRFKGNTLRKPCRAIITQSELNSGDFSKWKNLKTVNIDEIEDKIKKTEKIQQGLKNLTLNILKSWKNTSKFLHPGFLCFFCLSSLNNMFMNSQRQMNKISSGFVGITFKSEDYTNVMNALVPNVGLDAQISPYPEYAFSMDAMYTVETKNDELQFIDQRLQNFRE